ncbi:substrate-binding periplasmic protein [Aestuariirhabdus litorea]|uniref:Solute-binding protein family 3/N-terminal domain-containing protein n=1 Tax=Aestuariirhabdus litorea TaxID=2528527 RepID=A0A3P3VLK7_9GAMM|nr:transporter substrate-binding domain-containing protein [Aestuariirhabdus litorea]RRJ83294.1 hypothetical protein D0544_15845 [Aestuariirhabdus litorea]RWW93454.1 transporter substrate-binding domain-containing protein [Endozoicomonadaceae bacterium GTF-13]
MGLLSKSLAVMGGAALLFSSALWGSPPTPPLSMMRQDSPPKYFPVDAGTLGLCDQLYLRLQERLKDLGVESRIEAGFTPIKRILYQVEHEGDRIFCGAGRNAEREQRFIYSEIPLYEVSNVIAVHKDNPWNPKTLSDLANGSTLVALYGTSSARFLKTESGAEVYDRFHTPMEALSAVAHPDRDMAFYYHDLGINYLIRESGLPLRRVSTRFRTVPQWMIYGRQMDPRLIETVEQVLREMQDSGELDEMGRRFLD